jgi:4-carboxymuconolactone decarboxylase
MKIRATAIALLSVIAMQSAGAEEPASVTRKPMLTNEDVQTVSPALGEYAQRRLLGDVWKRPDLAPRDRSIITMAALIARNQTTEMSLHLTARWITG